MHPVLIDMREKAFCITESKLKATDVPLPEGLDMLSGYFKDAPVEMFSKAWQTEKFRLIRYTGLYSPNRISTFNFVMYPQDYYDAPIFASDWVMLGQKLRIAVIDAMPLFPNEAAYTEKWVKPFMPLQKKSETLAPIFERKLSWSTQYLGEAACLATNAPAHRFPNLASLWESYLALYLSLTKQMDTVSPEREKSVKEWHQLYNKAHREVEDRRNPYMSYFGIEVGKRYNREFLFSDSFGRSANPSS